jgi:hypothetical protein
MKGYFLLELLNQETTHMKRIRLKFFVALTLSGLFSVLSTGLAQLSPSRNFKPEGHGGTGTYYFPDDDIRRVTAVPDVVTPHIDWGVPLAGGPLRVLALAHKEQGRWPIELSQRFDMELTTVYAYNRSTLGNREYRAGGLFVQGNQDVEARLLQAMNAPIDVFISDVEIAALGDAVRQRLAELMDKGVGYVGPTEGLDLSGYAQAKEDEIAMVKATIPFAGLRALVAKFDSPEAAAGSAVKLWTNNTNSRIADLDGYPRDNEMVDANRLQHLNQIDLEWEAWSALTGRVLLWAAKCLEDADGVNINWPTAIARGDLPRKLKVQLASLLKTEVDVFDTDGRRHYRQYDEGRHVRLPVLPAGRYFIRVKSLRDYGVADWTFGTIQVTSPVEIASIKLDDIFKDPGEPVTATVSFSKRPPQRRTIVVEGLDNYGRVVSQQEHAPTKELTTQVDFSQSLHIYNYVNVKLLDGQGRTVHEDRHAFYIDEPGPARDDLEWFVWAAGAGFESRRRVLLKQFARMGMKGVLAGEESVAMVDCHAVNYVFRLKGGVDVDENGVTSPTLTSPAYVEGTIEDIQEKVRKQAPLSALFYYLGDDVTYMRSEADGGWSPSGRALLAQKMQGRYASLEALNEAWGTGYSSWDEIEPIKQGDAVAALDGGDPRAFCHWVDVQIYEDWMFSDFYSKLRDGIREIDSDTPANMGCSIYGWTPPGSAVDFWRFADGKDLAFQYPNPWVHDIFRSALAPGGYHGIWYGGYGVYNYRPFKDQDYLPWWSVFRGANLHGLYYGDQDAFWYTERLLGADLGPMETTARIIKNINELKGGIAKLLFNAERLTDRAAIVYAPSNIHTSRMFSDGLPQAAEWDGMVTNNPELIYMQCWEGMSYMLLDMGIAYDVIHDTSLTDGRALREKYDLLALPFSVRLTSEHAEVLSEFVKGGGVLLTDIYTGLLDERCKSDHAGVLADLMGVQFSGGLPHDRSDRQIVVNNQNESLGIWTVDKDVRKTKARAFAQTADGTPSLLVNQSGRGMTILLNLMARQYQITRTLGREMLFRDSLAGILANHASIKPPIDCQVASADEDETHRIQVTEFNRYRLDKAHYVGVLRHHKMRGDDAPQMADWRPKPCWISLDRKSHVYDVRGNMYRGFTDKIEDVIYPAQAELYALMPYEIRGLDFSAHRSGDSIHAAGQVLADAGTAGLSSHILHFEVTDPSGNLHPEYTTNILAKAGAFERKVFLGHNAEKGRWHVTVREVVSGITRSVDVEFQP